MNSISSSEQETPVNPGEWLSLGRHPSHSMKNSEPQARPKIFSCNYCMRKFYSSQALGGHQNAHKRERGAVQQYQSHKTMPLMALPMNATMIRSLGVRPHSVGNKSSRDGSSTIARFNESNTEFGTAWQTSPLEEGMDSTWPGSFRLDDGQSEQLLANSNKLDLNLKL